MSWHRANWWAAAACFGMYHVFLRPVSSLPVYANSSPKTYAFVLCTDMNAAVTALRAARLHEHSIGASWLETNCISIDPCLEVNSRGEAVPADTWLHANNSVLATAGTASSIEAATTDTQAHNYGSLEFARIPEGLRVETCAPNYDVWRSSGVIVCNEDTYQSFSAGYQQAACPSETPFSLLDCIHPLQYDHTQHHLHWRPPTQIMHFGDQTWQAACVYPYNNSLVEKLCNMSRDDYSIAIPQAAQYGTTSLIKYSFLPTYGCHSSLNNELQVLSREAAPNRIIDCPNVENGLPHRLDELTCDFTCNNGYVKHGDHCVSECEAYTTTCPPTFKASTTCEANSIEHYGCEECDTREGHKTDAWSASTPTTCAYTACEAGTYSTGHTCTNCPVNTITNTSGQTQCTSCNTVHTGLYAAQAGASSCTSCLGHDEVSSMDPETVCTHAGRAFITDFDHLRHLFDKYTEDKSSIVLSDFVDKFCQEGYACVPCEPGYYEKDHKCEPCAYGTYQPNFGATSCHACNDGQNTTQEASTSHSQCVCMPGFA